MARTGWRAGRGHRRGVPRNAGVACPPGAAATRRPVSFSVGHSHSDRRTALELFRRLRAILDAIYLAAGVIAALCLVAILALIVLQMLARWTGLVFIGATDYAGYAMAAASFPGLCLCAEPRLAYPCLDRAQFSAERGAPRLEIWCFGVGAASCGISSGTGIASSTGPGNSGTSARGRTRPPCGSRKA